MNQIFVLSYPKSGRTWIRAFMLFYGNLIDTKIEIQFKHSIYHNNPKKERLFLVRNPCAILLSLYFEYKYRSRNRTKKNIELKSVGSFIRSKYGVIHLSQRWKEWLSGNCTDQLEVRYEDLFDNIWQEIFEWFDIEINEDAILEAHEMCKFNKIKNNLNIFIGHKYANKFLAKENGILKTQPINPETHKFRQGRIDGYLDYLTSDDIIYIRKNVPEAARWYSEYI